MPKTAGVLLMVTGGVIKANTKGQLDVSLEGRALSYRKHIFLEKFETACLVDENVKIHPFAFRTHTHQLGKYYCSTRNINVCVYMMV